MRLRHQANAVVLDVPCKVNLYLEVLAKRPDGYHELETLMATTELCDTLEFAPLESPELVFDCRWAAGCEAFGNYTRRQRAESDLFSPLPETKDNLAFKAIELVRQEAALDGRTGLGARVRLVKRIPAAAGLGGASADAAAALVAANEAWQLGWSHARLMDLAAKLGSDVPFFLTRCAAICRGRGEKIEEVAHLRRRPLVIVRPLVGLSTPAVFKHCRPRGTAFPGRPESEVDDPPAAQDGQGRPSHVSSAAACVEQWNKTSNGGLPEKLFNRLEAPARQLSPHIESATAGLKLSGLLAQQMSGSGSSVFGVARTMRHARRAAGRLRCMGIGFAVATACPE